MEEQDSSAINNPAQGDQKRVWSYHGYQMSPGEFNTAMVHLYRGEITRSNMWRTRLDTTTNWAVVTLAGLLTFAFGSNNHHHVTILLGIALTAFFLFIEARRYRYYELWSLRVRLMETDFFGAMLAPPFGPSDGWARSLNESLLNPSFPITMWEAVGRRLRRNYIWSFLILAASWLIKLTIHPGSTQNLDTIILRAAIGPLPGWGVTVGVLLFYIGLILLAGLTAGLQRSAGEVLPRGLSEGLFNGLADAAHKVLPEDNWPFKRHRYLTFIITGRYQAVADQLMTLLKHGVTTVDGTGMYSGKTRHILLCAVEPDELAYLKTLVYTADPGAFIVVNPVEGVYGSGFQDLAPRWRQASESNNKPGSESRS
ncbi:MAG: DUF2270 domain-containing protein [Anaerolineae bacterium]